MSDLVLKAMRVAEGRLPGFKVGGSWRFKRGEIEAWIERQVEERKKGGIKSDYRLPH